MTGGGSGERYVFDPALVHALQFKVATIVTGPKPLSFCIDALGIIR